MIDSQANVKTLGLSKRTVNTLIRNGVSSLSELITLSEEDIMNMDGMGAGGLGEIRDLAQQIAVNDDLTIQTYSIGEYWKEVSRDERNFNVLVDYYNGNSKLTLQDLADKYKVSRERIRQIISNGTERIYYAFTSGIISPRIAEKLVEYANKRTEIHMINISDAVFTGIGIANLAAAFRPKVFQIVSNRNVNGNWFTNVDDNLNSILNIVVDGLKNHSKPLLISEVKELYSIDDSILMSIKGIIEKDGYVPHEKNKVTTGSDRFFIITRYLESVNRPASIPEIISNTCLTFGQIRGALSYKNTYVNVGKSVYDLVDREYNELSAAELAVNILTAENRALKIEAVIKYIQRYRNISKTSAIVLLYDSRLLFIHDNYVLIKGWPLEMIKRETIKKDYRVSLEDAVLETINASDEIFDREKITDELKKYGNSVSMNPNSIRGTLIRLADKGRIIRVGGARTGCYARKIVNGIAE